MPKPAWDENSLSLSLIVLQQLGLLELLKRRSAVHALTEEGGTLRGREAEGQAKRVYPRV
jgi:hypothetical protein